MEKPLVTIITAVYNGKQFIEEAITSVINQTYKNIQYVIIDGGSADGTTDIIKKYSSNIDFWISEKDKGLGDAWNKGLMQAKGEIIGLLNADDYYSKDTVCKVVESLDPDDNVISFGDTVFIDRITGQATKPMEGAFREDAVYDGFGFFHTTCFIPRKLYNTIGMFDLKYKIAVDSDFLLRGLKNGTTFKRTGNITYMRNGGLSFKQEKTAITEFYRQLHKYKFNEKKILIALFRRYRWNILSSSTVLIKYLFG